MRLKHISYILSALLFLSTLACSDGEDGAQGEIGPVGMQGQQGNDGNPGAVGADGQNAAGFNQLTQYGAITLTLEGTRADNVPFTDESTFKFAPVGGNAIGFTNDVIFIDQGDDTTTRFLIARFLSTPDEEFQETWIEMDFQVVNLGEENEEVQALAILTITDYAVVGEDNKFFVMDHQFISGDDGVSDFEFSDLIFDPETNSLTFSYSFTVDGEKNITGNELSISGTADVIVLEDLD